MVVDHQKPVAIVRNPLSPQRRWKAITLATLLLVPGFWMMLAGLVATETGDVGGAPDPGASLALGIAVIPFVYIVLAFVSNHPHAAIAVAKAMGLTVLVGVPVSVLAGDAVTGMVAGVGAGGIAALRADDSDGWKARAIAIAGSAAVVFVLVHFVGAVALLPAPILPFTAIGIADHLAERPA